MGELVAGHGPDWVYPKHMGAQYRKANCIGVMKSDAWEGVGDVERALLMLQYNGRHQYRKYPHEYYQALLELRDLWERKGAEADFYERYYVPKALALSAAHTAESR
jgi:hypothetical protein